MLNPKLKIFSNLTTMKMILSILPAPSLGVVEDKSVIGLRSSDVDDHRLRGLLRFEGDGWSMDGVWQKGATVRVWPVINVLTDGGFAGVHVCFDKFLSCQHLPIVVWNFSLDEHLS